jgi:RCC1-like G exchanging factor-like protein
LQLIKKGEPQFLRPLTDKNRIFRQRKPWRLRWADRNNADLTNVACGNGFSLIAVSGARHLKGHHLFGTGMNTESQIGFHQTSKGDIFKYIIEPALIELPIDRNKSDKFRIIDIACGRAHSVVVTNMGIFTFGNNSYGQCSRPIIEDEIYFGNQANLQNVYKYFELESDDEVVSVRAGQDHNCFLTKKGHVFTNGWSADGQLGIGIYTTSWKPQRVKGDLEGNKIKQISTKGDFVLALSESGEVFGWGNNEYKQLSMSDCHEPQVGIPKHLKLPSFVKKPIISVAASGTHCLIIDTNKRVWSWGHGLLGKGPRCEESSEPTQIPDTLFGIHKELKHTLDNRPIAVHCGLNCSAVTLENGSLFMWGNNRYGNLGTGDDKDAYFPLRVNIPAFIKKLDCGPDQTFAICKTNI